MSINGKIESGAGKTPARRPSLKINAISNWGALCVNVLIGFLLTPYIIKHIDKGGYGIWTLVASFVGYFGLLRLGVGASIMRYVPLYDGRNQLNNVIGTFTTAMVMYLAVAFLILVVSVGGAGQITVFFNGDEEFTILVKLIGLAAAIGCPAAIIDAMIRSRERFVAANMVAIITALTRAVGLVSVLFFGYGLAAMGWVAVGVALLGLLLNYVLLKKIYSEIKFPLKMVSSSHLWPLLSFGLMATLMSFGFLLRFNSDKIIIGRFMSKDMLGIYAIAATLLLYYRNCIGAISRVLRPRFAYLDGKDEQDEARNLFLKSTKLVALVACGISVLLLVTGPSFIKLWVGEGFEAVYPVLCVLALAQMIDQSQTPSISLLGGMGRQGVLAVFAIAEGVIGVILAIVLVKIYAVMGVAVGLAVPMIVIQMIIRPVYVCQFLGIPLLQYYKDCLVRPWLLVILLFLTGQFIHPEEHIETWPMFLAFATALGLLYVLVSYRFVLNRQERIFILKKIAGLGLLLQSHAAAKSESQKRES